MTIIAQTARFTIRPYQPEDETAYLEMLSDARVNIHLPVRNVEENRVLFQESMQAANEPFNRWSIIGTNNEYLGMCMLRQLDKNDAGALVIGYALPQSQWGKGIATGVVAALTSYGFGFPNIQKITAVTTPDNLASQAVLLKDGFIACGTSEHDGVQLVNFIKQKTV